MSDPPKAWLSISKNAVRTLGPIGLYLLVDRVFTHEATATAAVGIIAASGACLWGAWDWLKAHTAIERVVDFTDATP